MRLATWNLEHFWSVPDAPLLIRKNGQETRLRDARLLDRTQQAVTGLAAHILCLQEIGGVGDLQFLCPGHQVFAERRLNPNLPPRERLHGIGMAVDPKLKVERLPDLKLSQAVGGDAYARDGLVLRVEGRFLLVGLHLKSGCRDKLRLDKRRPCKALNAQVEMLCAWMQDQREPMVLMGDFNRILNQPRDTIWQQLRAAANLNLSPATYNQIDHILLPPKWPATPISIKGMKGFSDHQPVVMDAKVAI